jgi:hypothetical protein
VVDTQENLPIAVWNHYLLPTTQKALQKNVNSGHSASPYIFIKWTIQGW